MTAQSFITALNNHIVPGKAKYLAGFFQTAPGGYGEGDKFIGVTVVATREVCREFKDLPLPEVEKLLSNPFHEYRLAAVILLVGQYKKRDPEKREAIFKLYMKALEKGWINSWDIVDTSAAYIIGPHEEDGDRQLLFKLARDPRLWHRRTGILSAFWYTQHKDFTTTMRLAEVLVDDKRDMVQKAVGWQLREVGKRGGRDLLLKFLDKHAKTMPRTALRYAIEHLPVEQRMHYMGLAKQ